ncbi:IS66 family insertion sequence element accessory protein TnpB [Marinomonas algicola]|uniref:IS66 family insertion sequence element accessory protein TnpB n=1 Tax=Marinomonas algicola TaxID=2773454 RepID=UPI00174CE412|nr:IS66 family insertion sequence element accessory protein TnpB [Marinomonas algicola]
MMFMPDPSAKIWLHTQPTDMRKSYQGLLELIKQQIKKSPLSGHFVFINRRKTQMKTLYFEPSGYCIWCKRLAQGLYHYQESAHDKYAFSPLELQHVLEGIKVEKYRQFKRYRRAP